MESLVSYLVAAMLAWVPPHAHAPVESRDHVLERYESIARDVLSVALDENEAPVFDGPDSRAETALLMLAVASYESSFSKRVDEGVRRGDNGHSYCLMQIHVGQGATREGWRARQLIGTASVLPSGSAYSAGVVRVLSQTSVRRPAERLCERPLLPGRGDLGSRVWRARAWWQAHAPPKELANAS